MSDDRPYFVTTPIYYVNDLPHLGHAYPTVAADVLARFMRLDGRRVKFLTGTDEHGQKVARSAQALGLTPQQYADQVSAAFRDMDRLLDISYDDYIRTTEERHVRGVQALWCELERRGEIYLGRFSGWYCVRDEAFYDESELVEGPHGVRTAPTGAEVEWLEEENYFFRLSAWQDRLLEWYEANPDAVAPRSRRNEVISFVKSGLKDLSVSRTSFTWGIPVPGDPRHVMYVWLDALANYITALGYPEIESGDYAAFWPAELHIVGKDILRFHAVYWPAFLMAAGLEPPRRVFATGWWTVEGQKMSKSLGNGIPPDYLVGRYGADPARYFLLRELPFGNDGDFSHRAIVGRLNGDLANDFGNLAQRVLAMIHRNCAAAVPEPDALMAADRALLSAAAALLDHTRAQLSEQGFHLALEAIWRVVGEANRYVDEQAPWALRRTDPARMKTVLYVLAETLRHLAILTQPFVPGAAAKLLAQLSVPDNERSFGALAAAPLRPGTALPKPEGIFPRFVEGDAQLAG
ncbi:MAG: methionine--tRNA ligase [Alphaproteobacteria bacterium]|nr:methionine--tRNA ligase [Alphaproteobacteria bacterium]